MKKLWNNMIVAFAMYSKIPMPAADWSPENIKYVMVFFPWIGAALGALQIGWFYLCRALSLGSVFYAGGVILISFFVTGGIHYDGFLDTMDALSSWREKEQRLKILKDPHAGAFAIICGCVYFAAFLCAATELSGTTIMAFAFVFFMSRCFSGLSVILFPNANPKGTAATFKMGSDKRNSMIALLVQLILAIMLGGILVTPYIFLAGAAALLVWIYYYFKSKKYFGGITGDLAGYFLSVCEITALIVLIFAERIITCCL